MITDFSHLFRLVHLLYFLSGSETMSVLLDNIQFYHGPSKPAKPPYFAFNSKKGSNGSNALLSREQPAFSTKPVSSATGDSTMVPTGFLPPAAYAEEYTAHQHGVGSPNLFDLELARSWRVEMPLLETLEASDSDAYLSPRRLGGHCQDNSGKNGDCKFRCRNWSAFNINNRFLNPALSSFGANSSESVELDGSDIFPRSQPSCMSPFQPPQSPYTAVLSPDSAISHPEIKQSYVVEDVQWRRTQPSNRSCFGSRSPAHGWDKSEVSTAFGNSSNTPPSAVSSCSGVISKKQNNMSPCISSPEDCPDHSSDDYEASQTGLISYCSPRVVAEPGSYGPVDPLHVNMPDSINLERAAGRESSNSQSRTSNVQDDPVLPNPRKCKERKHRMPWTGKQDNTRDKCHTSVAVVIPPPQPRPVRTLRSKPKPVPLNAYGSESSEDFDDSADEDFLSDATQSDLSDDEDSVEEKHGPPTRLAPCYSDTPFGPSTGHYGGRDIVGRAFLTIETQGSEPTFFLTFVPDNVPSISYVAAHSPPHNSKKAGGALKASMGASQSTRKKSKRRTYSTDENNLLVKLKEERNLTWKEITDYFPDRASASLQVHYSTKLKHRRVKRRGPRSRRGENK